MNEVAEGPRSGAGNVCRVETGAVYPEVGARSGFYESFYVKAASPGGGQAIWIRYTVHKRPGEAPTGSLWVTRFDRDSGAGPKAAKVTVASDLLAAPPGPEAPWLRIGESEIGPGRLRGRLPAGPGDLNTGAGPRATEADALAGEAAGLAAVEAEWDLTFDLAGPAPLRYLPQRWMYRAPLPRTKLLAPAPGTRFTGRLTLEGETVDLDGWPGMVGHNWGAEHAERWVWLEGTGFGDEASEGDYLDCAAARVKVAGRMLPWMAVGMLRLDGEEHRLGGPRRLRSTAIEARPGSCDFVLPGDRVTVRGRLSAPPEHFVGWLYADPDGPGHHTINCSVSDLELAVERSGRPTRRLVLPAAGAYELGMRETDHGVPIQPYGDG